jgi:hypothetical protein
MIRFRDSTYERVAAGRLLIFAMLLSGCASAGGRSDVAKPDIVAHSEWHTSPPVGHAADGTRRNIPPGGTLRFRDVAIDVLATTQDSTAGAPPTDFVQLRLTRGATVEEKRVRERGAFNWQGYHIAIVAIPNPGELGAGLVAIEIASAASLPPAVAASDSAGGAAMRLRVPHEITHVTLHHTGSAEPLRPDEDPRAKLRGLQSWGASDRNWWDVPYHFLLDLDGTIYEGRDHHFMGETNTTYDPRGHFLISVIGNYGRQQPTQAQIEAIADLMAWAVATYDLPLDRIGGHYNYAETSCPGEHLRKYLEDGTFRRMVEQRLTVRGIPVPQE